MIFPPKLPISMAYCLKDLASHFASEQKANTIVYQEEKASGYYMLPSSAHSLGAKN